jgi:hypothetical protein
MKKSIVSLVLVAVSCPALTAEPSAERLVGCADIKDARDRLACFDREVAPVVGARSQPAPAPAPPSAPVARAPAPSTAPAPTPAPAPSTAPAAPSPPAFGDEQLAPKSRATAPEVQQSLHARIERLRTVTATDYIVYLDNGQAWRHQDQSLGSYLREGEAITISKGALGSYRLTRDAGQTKNWIRVTRVR